MESMNFFDGGSDATSKVFDSLVGADLLEGNLRKEVYSAFRNWYNHLPNEQKQSEIESLNNTSRFYYSCQVKNLVIAQMTHRKSICSMLMM